MVSPVTLPSHHVTLTIVVFRCLFSRYDVFTLEMPMMQYKITLDVLELQGITVNNATGSRHVNWRLISTFHLSPSRTIGRSKSGRVQQKLLSNLHTHTRTVCIPMCCFLQVIAELQGSLLGSKSIKDLSSKNLLIPSVRMWPKGKPYPPAYSVSNHHTTPTCVQHTSVMVH